MGCRFLFQGIFPTKELNPSFLHYRKVIYQLSYEGSLLEEVSINLTTEPSELTQDWGNRLFEGTNSFLCTRTQGERSGDPTRDWSRLAHEYPGISSESMGQRWPAPGLQALSVAVHAWDILKEVAIIFISSTIVWPQVKQQGRNTALTSTENWINDLLSMPPPIRTRPFPPQSNQLQGPKYLPLALLGLIPN